MPRGSRRNGSMRCVITELENQSWDSKIIFNDRLPEDLIYFMKEKVSRMNWRSFYNLKGSFDATRLQYSAPMRSSVPMRSAPPPPAPTPMQTAAPQRQGPGLFGQMAATAGGVAIGSAVGHTIGHALTGGGSRHEEQAMAPTEQQQPMAGQQPLAYQQQQKPCEFELQEFLKCAQTHDLSLCEGFNQVLKECRMRFGV